MSHQNWSHSQKYESSTYRELYTVLSTLLSFGHLFKNTAVQWRMDNTGVVAAITKGSMKQDIHKLSLQIDSVVNSLKISLYPVWIPRDLNQDADHLSRIIERDDWAIQPFYCQKIQKITCDRFADHKNKQISHFNSKYWVPGSAGVDGLAQSWEGQVNWAVPPVKLIPETLSLLSAIRVPTIIVVPQWYSAPFWPLLTQLLSQPISFEGPLTFPGSQIIFQGSQKNSIFGPKFKGNLLAYFLYPPPPPYPYKSL